MNVAFTDGHAKWFREGTPGLQFPESDWPDGDDGNNWWDLGPILDDSHTIRDPNELYQRFNAGGCW